ncbi:MAG TPA: N-acetylneuraminate synthase family protein [Lachnospiraceae bacterium]|mgnify:CR=1 FL=1|jgi:sialic acid synthase SpsE/mannose-6-phosphate isomerase-like protein (cupin superfamily)|nr:N-acetylneuraminate synthase family protein [Lachnospiraceae bacterium]
MGQDKSIFEDLFIFEMANSHQGSVEHGKDIIHAMGKIARKYNIKAAVKLQFRDLDTFIHPDFKDREDVKHIPRFMSTKLCYEQFEELVEAVREEGMVTMSTPFDEKCVEWCMDMGIDIIKVASCSALDWPLLAEVAATKKPLIISTGGKTMADIDKLFNFFTHRGCEFSFLHCIAEYPAPLDGLQLNFIDRMNKRYRDIVIGYSGHEAPDDNMAAMLAVAKGAKILERHVGLPTDTIKLNAYSMNPEQAEKWVEAALLAKSMCETKKDNEKYISQAELDSLRSLMRGVYAKRDIKEGEVLTTDDVFFAMPCGEKQLPSGDFKADKITASRSYKANEEIHEKPKANGVGVVRNAIHDAKGMLYEAGIALGNDFEVELSHHYGIPHFRQYGAIIINIINREYCKKYIIVLPGQKHPEHAHRIKEETFQLLYGDLTVEIDGKAVNHMQPGDMQTVLRGEYHAFSSVNGAIFEEVSTQHMKSDSYYREKRISDLDPMERKTFLKKW